MCPPVYRKRHEEKGGHAVYRKYQGEKDGPAAPTASKQAPPVRQTGSP